MNIQQTVVLHSHWGGRELPIRRPCDFHFSLCPYGYIGMMAERFLGPKHLEEGEREGGHPLGCGWVSFASATQMFHVAASVILQRQRSMGKL